jgi:hypothetical protein
VFGRCSVRISPGTQAILTAVFRGFQFLQVNVSTESWLGNDRFSNSSFMSRALAGRSTNSIFKQSLNNYRSWLSHYATRLKVAGSIPDEAIAFLN